VVIKYLGSKRRLVPALAAIVTAVDARRALDLFTGTTRVAQAFKQTGAHVTAVDSARYADVLARCYIATDATAVDRPRLESAIARLDALPGRAGYVTEVFCHASRYFQPHNGERIDAIRDAIAREHAGDPLEPVLLTSLLEAADRVDSTTGLQMAYLKQWAPRASGRLTLQVPTLLPGDGRAVHGDAVAQVASGALGGFDLAYIDPPYNQHRYTANYHVWETIVAWDAPEHYGVACKRIELRDPTSSSAFNRRRAMPPALQSVIEDVDARVLVVSCSDEGWVGPEEIATWCAPRGAVVVVDCDLPRYVGARIGGYNPAGQRVGEVSHVRNTEHLVIAGPADLVAAAATPARQQLPGRGRVRERTALPRRGVQHR
jgi:adenine-specific DNA-methyltransferase